MRKSIFATALILATALSFTSCKDTDDSIDLSGEWFGDMAAFYTENNITYWAEHTEIVFIPDYDYATHGYGEEVDYFDLPCPIAYQNLKFEWRIKKQVLYVNFPMAPGMNVVINDYHFTHSRSRLEFTIDGVPCILYKLSDYYGSGETARWYWNHDSHMDDNNEFYHYHYRPGYYTKQRDNYVEIEQVEEGNQLPQGTRIGRDISRLRQE